MSEGARRELDLHPLKAEVSRTVGPFLEDLLGRVGDDAVAIAVVGDAVTPDFAPGRTEIRCALVLGRVGVEQLHAIAPLGRRYGKDGIAAPTILTPDSIESSRDVFPLEFLLLRLAHATVFGDDVFSGIEVDRADLRGQVERELRTALIRLRQGFLRTAGDARLLQALLREAAGDIFAELRGMLHLLERPIAHQRDEDLSALGEATGISVAEVRPILTGEPEGSRPDLETEERRFAGLYAFVHALSEKADGLLR